MDTYLDATVSDPEDRTAITVDACGVRGDSLTIVFCEIGSTDSSLASAVDKVQRSQNAKAIILAPPQADFRPLEESASDAFESGKVRVETLGWFDDYFDSTLQQTLHLIDLLGNEHE